VPAGSGRQAFITSSLSHMASSQTGIIAQARPQTAAAAPVALVTATCHGVVRSTKPEAAGEA
jgi:hypothetical protein